MRREITENKPTELENWWVRSSFLKVKTWKLCERMGMEMTWTDIFWVRLKFQSFNWNYALEHLYIWSSFDSFY